MTIGISLPVTMESESGLVSGRVVVTSNRDLESPLWDEGPIIHAPNLPRSKFEAETRPNSSVVRGIPTGTVTVTAVSFTQNLNQRPVPSVTLPSKTLLAGLVKCSPVAYASAIGAMENRQMVTRIERNRHTISRASNGRTIRSPRSLVRNGDSG